MGRHARTTFGSLNKQTRLVHAPRSVRTASREGCSMLSRFARTILIAAVLASILPAAGIAQTRDTANSPSDDVSAILAGLRETARMRDSLTQLADRSGGEVRDLLDEQIWQRQTELRRGVLDLVARLKSDASRGQDLTEMRATL